MNRIEACIFDLDGVVVDTAKYHYLAWKRLAKELGFDFTEKQNERLKGVSRLDSLNILLQIGGVDLSHDEKEKLAEKKNNWYLDYITKMTPGEILPGVKGFIEELKANNIKVALGSASKNANLILNQLGIINLFEVIIDGTKVSKAKPDPEIFLFAAKALNVRPSNSIVFEDAEAGIDAANGGGFISIGVGDPQILAKAKTVIPSFEGMTLNSLKEIIG